MVLSNPIRVLHVFNQMNVGGAETFIMNIYRRMDRNKIQFDFVVSVEDRGRYDDEIEALGGRIFRLPHPSDGIYAFCKEFDRTLKDNRPIQVIHSHVHFFSGLTISLAKRNHIPIRISNSHTTNDGKSSSLLRRSYRFFMRQHIIKNSTHLLGCSDEACISLFQKESNSHEKVHILTNGIDLGLFHPLRKKGNLRKELNLPEEARIIGHVGRFSIEKNHPHIIECFAAMHKKNPAFHLVLVGEGVLKPIIEQRVTAENLQSHVHFLGLRSDIPSLLTDFNVFLFPSFFEGVSLAMVEAQAAGLYCVVSSNVPRESALIKDLISFIPLEAPINDWTSALEKAMKMPPISYQDRVKVLTDHGYNITTSVRRLEQIYGHYH